VNLLNAGYLTPGEAAKATITLRDPVPHPECKCKGTIPVCCIFAYWTLLR
jgi:hypothetical protein